MQDGVFGTYLHGLFDTGELTEKLTAFLCKRKGIDPAGAELIPVSYTHLASPMVGLG